MGRKDLQKVSTAICPTCDAPIRFPFKPKLGQLVICGECDEQLEVVALSPLTLDWSEEMDDYDDYDDYEDEY